MKLLINLLEYQIILLLKIKNHNNIVHFLAVNI